MRTASRAGERTIAAFTAGAAAMLLCANLAACAGASRAQKPDQRDAQSAPAPLAPPGKTVLTLPEVLVVAGPPAERALGELDETQLFDCGVRAFDAGEWARSAACFGRLVDVFPASDRYGASLYNCALSLERLKQYDDALKRWETDLARYAEAAGPGTTPVNLAARAPSSDELDAVFHAAFAEHELGRLDAAAQRLKALLERPGIPDSRRGEGEVQQAVCLVEKVERARQAGERDPAMLAGRSEAEHLLRSALELYSKADQDGEADPALLAQAEFWIGEIYRSYFDEVVLDPAVQDEAALGNTLETKAQFLLSAQGHYLRAIRRGDGEWATASGFRIGELYESLHRQMVEAPPPKLSHEQVELYREELKKKVRVLLDKAMHIYEQTLATAERVNATSEYVKKTHEALERMRAMLVAQAPHASNPAPGAAQRNN